MDSRVSQFACDNAYLPNYSGKLQRGGGYSDLAVFKGRNVDEEQRGGNLNVFKGANVCEVMRGGQRRKTGIGFGGIRSKKVMRGGGFMSGLKSVFSNMGNSVKNVGFKALSKPLLSHAVNNVLNNAVKKGTSALSHIASNGGKYSSTIAGKAAKLMNSNVAKKVSKTVIRGVTDAIVSKAIDGVMNRQPDNPIASVKLGEDAETEKEKEAEANERAAPIAPSTQSGGRRRGYKRSAGACKQKNLGKRAKHYCNF